MFAIFHIKIFYYYFHLGVFVVYSTSVLCMPNTYATLTSGQYVSNKCQRVLEQQTDMLAKLKCLCCFKYIGSPKRRVGVLMLYLCLRFGGLV